MDRTPFRARVEALLLPLRTPVKDSAARLEQLKTLAPALEALFHDLVTAGDRHETVHRLGKILVQLRGLLAQTTPASHAVEQSSQLLCTALQDWLAQLPPVTESPGARGLLEVSWAGDSRGMGAAPGFIGMNSCDFCVRTLATGCPDR